MEESYTVAVGFAQCQLRHDYVEGTSKVYLLKKTREEKAMLKRF